MKTQPALLLLLMLLACSSSGSKETSTVDSAAVASADTTDITDLPDDETESDETEVDEDYEDGEGDSLEDEYNEWNTSTDEHASEFHQVTVSSSGYESQGDITWYFDSDMKPRYFKQQYAVEGSEGSTEFFISEGSVWCALIMEGELTKKWCYRTGGWSAIESEERTELDANFGSQQNDGLKQYLTELINVLNSLEVKSEENGILTLEHRQEESYGEVTSETVVTVQIPRILYDALVGG